MHGRYKKTVLRVTSLLRELEQDPKDLKVLLKLQRELIRLIRRTEQRISSIRADLAVAKGQLRGGRLPKEQSRPLKKRIDGLQRGIKDEQ